MLVVIVLVPIYPSFSLMNSDANAHGSDYDESSIITAYSDDSLGDDSYFSPNWLVTLRNTLPSGWSITSASPIDNPSLVTPEQADRRKSPKILRHTVSAWDTLARLSETYNVSVDAIRWANDISLDILKPWMIIKIPPTSWVIHIVKKWDTLWAIAMKYDIASIDISSFNQLSDKNTLRVGMELMIPWAQKNIASPLAKTPAPLPGKTIPVPQPKPTSRPITIDTTTWLKSSYSVVYTGKGRWFVAGNCTWYVAQNKNVDWRWNANAWIKNARAKWHKTWSTPIPGAIIQFSGRGYSRAYGHVGIVADVQGEYVIIKDMNYRGLYEVTIRKVKKNDPAIDGYIYID